MLMQAKIQSIEVYQWFKNGDHPGDYAKTLVSVEEGEIKEFTPEQQRELNKPGQVVRKYDPILDEHRIKATNPNGSCSKCMHSLEIHGILTGLRPVTENVVVCPGDYIAGPALAIPGIHSVISAKDLALKYEPLPFNGRFIKTTRFPYRFDLSIKEQADQYNLMCEYLRSIPRLSTRRKSIQVNGFDLDCPIANDMQLTIAETVILDTQRASKDAWELAFSDNRGVFDWVEISEVPAAGETIRYVAGYWLDPVPAMALVTRSDKPVRVELAEADHD